MLGKIKNYLIQKRYEFLEKTPENLKKMTLNYIIPKSFENANIDKRIEEKFKESVEEKFEFVIDSVENQDLDNCSNAWHKYYFEEDKHVIGLNLEKTKKEGFNFLVSLGHETGHGFHYSLPKILEDTKKEEFEPDIDTVIDLNSEFWAKGFEKICPVKCKKHEEMFNFEVNTAKTFFSINRYETKGEIEEVPKDIIIYKNKKELDQIKKYIGASFALNLALNDNKLKEAILFEDPRYAIAATKVPEALKPIKIEQIEEFLDEAVKRKIIEDKKSVNIYKCNLV